MMRLMRATGVAIGLAFAANLATAQTPPYSEALVKQILADAKTHGDARRGALVFRSTTQACLTCHLVGGQGGKVGPDLSQVGKCLPPEEIVESILWPKRKVKDERFAVRRRLRGCKIRRQDRKERHARHPHQSHHRTVTPRRRTETPQRPASIPQ